MPVPYLEEENIPAVIPINVGRQLFVDDFLIGGMEGIERRWYQARKYSGNPILKPETELEIYSAGNPVRHPRTAGVYWDENDGIFKMWYEAGMAERPGLCYKPRRAVVGASYIGNRTRKSDYSGYAPNSCGVIVDWRCSGQRARYKIYFRPPNDKSREEHIRLYSYFRRRHTLE